MLTPGQLAMLEFIERTVTERGVAPTVQEICDAFGYSSKGSAARTLKQLEERGAIRRLPNRARAIEVVRSASAIDRDEEVVMCLRKLITTLDKGGFDTPAWDRAVGWARRLVGQPPPGP